MSIRRYPKLKNRRLPYRKRSRGVAGRGPAPASVETEAFVRHDLEDTPAAESLGVGLPLDLENVKRKQNDLANADQAKNRQG